MVSCALANCNVNCNVFFVIWVWLQRLGKHWCQSQSSESLLIPSFLRSNTVYYFSVINIWELNCMKGKGRIRGWGIATSHLKTYLNYSMLSEAAKGHSKMCHPCMDNQPRQTRWQWRSCSEGSGFSQPQSWINDFVDIISIINLKTNLSDNRTMNIKSTDIRRHHLRHS